ncbi:MAG: 3'(2'),5'-bisphosphate nucleotidase CysQ [Caulobacteraceae bacterium]
MSGDLALIREAALEAGALALSMRGAAKAWAKGDSTPVTDADVAVDALLKQRLLGARPDYGWLSEETADNPARLSTRRQFVVDPIDGTVAFIKDRPWWAVSIAVVEDGRPVAGVIFAPSVDETYEAEAGVGATLNGAPIRVSETGALEGAAILADLRYLSAPGWPEPWPQMRVESRNSVAYRCCITASGAFDATLALSSKCDWDLAAADLIASEAGALVTDHKGRAFTYNRPSPVKPSLICAAPALHALIRARVDHIDLQSI